MINHALAKFWDQHNKSSDSEKRFKAVWKGCVIAEADEKDLIYIEGNWYFPPDALKKKYFKPSNKHTTCPWKGQASYYQVDVEGVVNEDGAWYYPEPSPRSLEIVKKNYTNYVAFWHGVEVKEKTYA